MDELIHELRSYAHQRLFDGSEKYDQHILYLADQIEDEMANYVELPKDADGETIHIGDYLHSDENGKDFPCRGFELTLMQGVRWWTVESCYDAYSGTSEYVSAKSCHHVKPDSWERIISDATAFGAQMKRRTYQIGDFVERCKRLAGEDA